MTAAPGTDDELLEHILELAVAEIPGGYVIVDLRRSQDFWASEDRDLIDPIWVEYLAHSERLAARVGVVWGEPARVELGPVLDRALAGEALPPFPETLAQFGVHVDLWRVGSRFVCLGVGQDDKELPVRLYAAAGDHWLTS